MNILELIRQLLLIFLFFYFLQKPLNKKRIILFLFFFHNNYPIITVVFLHTNGMGKVPVIKILIDVML